VKHVFVSAWQTRNRCEGGVFHRTRHVAGTGQRGGTTWVEVDRILNRAGREFNDGCLARQQQIRYRTLAERRRRERRGS